MSIFLLSRWRVWRWCAPAFLCVFLPNLGMAQPVSGVPAEDDIFQPMQSVHADLPTVADLATLVDMAWARSPRARQVQGQQLEAQSQSEQAARWFPGAPSLTLGQRTGDRPGQRTLREQELAIQAPVWSVGQRTATQEASQAALESAQAEWRASRLELAHQVLGRIGALNLAKVRLQHAQAHAQSMRQLDADVARRVRAGDMARADALLIRQDVLQADAAVRQAQMVLIEAEHAFHVQVGEVRPALGSTQNMAASQLSPAQLDELQARAHDRVMSHPRLAAARAAETHLARQHALQTESVRAPWELGIQHRRDQEAQAQRTTTSWGVNLRVPLADEPARRQAAMAAAAAADVAAAEARRTHAVLESDLLEAIHGVRHQQALQAYAQDEALAARSRAELIRNAYALGEMGLSDRLKAELALTSAELRVAEQTELLAQARARLQFALGEQP